MNKIKLALAAIAFVTASGAAFATSTTSTAGATCPEDVSSICDPGEDACCTVPSGQTRSFDGQTYTGGQSVLGDLRSN